ncbi:DUF4440 domain-containing protein [Vreelandella neptunia]|uniref:DUF4440 domain-containing protein n=1 Tax=Vreelandella neptunia TaxID=115551 RepID=UPI00315A5CD7
MLFNKLVRGIIPGVAVASLAVGSSVVAADDTDTLSELFAAVENAVNNNNGEEWAELMYADDVVVVGEGSEGALRGMDELMPTIESIIEGSESCSIRMDDAKVNGDQAWSFADWTCQVADGEAFDVRTLYVWEKQDAGWRVTAEMYGFGTMQ